MNVIQKYITYLKDNPEHYWFKRKAYGWGWTPARWEGWLVILTFIVFLAWNGFRLGENPSEKDLMWFFVNIIIASVVLMIICFKTGEKPKWQWGLPKEGTVHHDEDEYLDLVDDQDLVIGKKLRSEVYANNLSNFRVINCFIVNTRGELWIPRRSAHKRMFPLCLDMSMGGHVSSGETYEQAFEREMKEELTIDIKKIPYRMFGHLTPQEHHVSAFMNVYAVKLDQAPVYNQNDFVGYYWLTPEAFFERLKHGEKTKDDLPKLVKIFYS